MGGIDQIKYTDEQLINQMKANVEIGTGLVMEQYCGLVFTVCSNYLCDREDVKECVNEVFAEFSLNYEKFKKEKGSLRNYLCKIAKNCAIDKYNKNMRQKQAEQAAADQWIEENEYGIGREHKELLDGALDHLSPVDSRIIRMKYYDGMTFKEISEQLHMDYNLVKKRSQRSYKKLLKIILLGLLLALLAACAAIIFRQYRVSEQSGFLWSVETAAYGNEEETDEIVIGDVAYQVTDAAYYDCQMKLEVTTQWRGEKEGDWKEEFKRIVDEQLFGDERQAMNHGTKRVYKYNSGTIFLGNSNKVELECRDFYIRANSMDDRNGTMKIYLEGRGFIEADENGEIPLRIALLQDHMVTLTLKELPIMEYKYKEEKIRLADGSILAIGPNYSGDSNTILSLYHIGGTEYEAASWLTNHFGGIGIWADKVEHIVLLDQEGNAVESQRVSGEDSVDPGIKKVFQIYFPKVSAGEYTLEIPYLCLLKEGNTEEIVMNLPMEDNVVLQCDYSIHFEDGCGYHITGIRRQKEVEIMESMMFDGTWVEQEIIIWKYYLTYETVSAGNLIFCHSYVEGTTEKGRDVTGNMDMNNQLYLKIQQEEAPQQCTVRFKDPVYILDELISAQIIINE